MIGPCSKLRCVKTNPWEKNSLRNIETLSVRGAEVVFCSHDVRDQ